MFIQTLPNLISLHVEWAMSIFFVNFRISAFDTTSCSYRTDKHDSSRRYIKNVCRLWNQGKLVKLA